MDGRTLKKGLRIRKPTREEWHQALPWYQDPLVLAMSEGLGAKPFELDKIERMYSYLTSIGELYFIEIEINGDYVPIGDATFSKETLPILIGNQKYWGRGIGKLVLTAFIQMGKERNFDLLHVKEIYHHNERSKRLYTSLGFVQDHVGEKGTSYLYRYEKAQDQ